MRNLLPHFIAEQFQQNSFEGSFSACTLFVDVSGFTRLTESLMLHGNEGAEVLSSTLNALFQPMVSAVYEQGGFISNFAGDALTAIYPKPLDRRLDPTSVLRSAEAIQRFFARHGVQQTKFGAFDFAVKIGVGLGEIDWGIIGTTDHAFFVRGAGTSSASRAEQHAAAGQIVLDEHLLGMVESDGIEFEAAGDGYARLLALTKQGERVASRKRPPLTKAIARQFLPQEVVDFTGGGEFRDVASVFLGFDGDVAIDDLRRFVAIVLQRAREFSAYVKEVDFPGYGVIPCYFGAPVAFENNIERALDFMLAVQNEAAEIPSLRLHGGITYGRAFTGMVGGSERSQYSVIGTTVNLSARLMVKAKPGEVYVAERVAQQQGYGFEHIADIAYKNVAQPTPTYLLVGTKQQSQSFFAEQMVGRTAELRMLKNFATPIFDGEFAGIAYIYGEPGVGKSQLAYGVQQVLRSKHDVGWLHYPCDPMLRKPFNPFVSMLNRYFEQSSERSRDENREVFDRTLDDLIASVEASRAEPVIVDEITKELRRTRSIIGALLGLRWDNSLYEQLDAKGRYENTLFALKSFVQAESLLRPVVLQIEDAHWIDSDSAAALKVLVRRIEQYPIMLLATSRYNDDGTMPRIELENVLEIDLRLKTFSTDELRSFAEAQLGGNISEALLAKLEERAMSNPFFAGQMLGYFKERELLGVVDGVWQLKPDAANDATLPETIYGLLIARIDRLTQRVKDVVKAAAVIGMEFDVTLLSAVLRSAVVKEVTTAEERQIWGVLKELRYLFKHGLLRDAAYEMQLHVRLRELHHLTAEALIVVHGEKPEEYYDDIAYHFEKAEVTDRAIDYLEKAGDYAKDRYRNQEAIELYDRLLACLDGNQERVGLRIDISMKMGRVLELIGEWPRATALYREMVVAAERVGDPQRVARARQGLGRIYWVQGEYDDAMENLTAALRICEELGDRPGISAAAGTMGSVYKDRGEYDRALECYDQKEAICRELGDRAGLSLAIGNMGSVYYRRGEYDRALECYGQQEALCRKIGDRRGLSIAIGNMGLVYADRGEYDRALECHREREAICRELGDRHALSVAISNMGVVYAYRGEYDRALEYFSQREAICREIGDRHGLSITIGNMGLVYYARGEYDRALECYRQQEAICRELRDRRGLATAIGEMGLVYYARGEYDRALECLREQEVICREIGDRSRVSLAIGNIGNVYVDLREYERALECYAQAAAEHRKIGFRYGLTSWLAGTAGVLLELTIAGGAMPAYLPTYVPGAAGETWHAMSLRVARSHAEECVAVSSEISKPDTLFSGSIRLARVDAAEGRRDLALQHLYTMLQEATDDDQRADLRYWLWNLTPNPSPSDGEGNREEHRSEALRLYESLLARTPKHDYRKRIDALSGDSQAESREN